MAGVELKLSLSTVTVNGLLVKACELANSAAQGISSCVTMTAEAISSIAKKYICCVCSLFQGIKTLLKLPFLAVVIPSLILLEKIEKGFGLELVKGKAQFVEDVIRKDAIMTLILARSMFLKNDEISLQQTFENSFKILSGKHVDYNFSPDKLWTKYEQMI